MGSFISPRKIIETGIFERSGNFVLEIGCGNGEFLVHLHEAKPETFIIGLDISNFALRKAISRVKNIDRVMVTKSEGRWFLTWIVPRMSLNEVYVLFPDPWPGREKRRLVDKDFVDLLAHKLKEGGRFVFATDVEDYYSDVMEIIETSKFFRTVPGMDAFYTKYERKWKSQGKKTFSMTSEKVASPPPVNFRVYLNRPIKTRITPETLERLKNLEVKTGNNFFKVLDIYRRNDRFLLKTVFRTGKMGQKQLFKIEGGEIDILPVQLEVYPEPLLKIIEAIFG